MAAMKVTMLLSRFDMTGMTTHTLELLRALVSENVDATLVVGYRRGVDVNKDALYMQALETGARVVTIGEPRRESALSKMRTAILLIYNILKSGGVIHVQSPYLSWAPWLLRRKFVSTFHVNDLVKCFYYKKATQLIAISNETRQYAMAMHGYKPEDITVVNHGVSMRFYGELTAEAVKEKRVELNLPTDKIVITLVGSVEPRKGHDILLKAVSALPAVTRGKIHVAFVGSDKTETGENDKWLHDVIAETATADMVSIYEYQDPELFYKVSDVFVLPSWVEGFPCAVIEAMLSGCVCVRSDTEGASEQIQNGETGFLFDKGDYRQLSKIMYDVIENESLRKKMASAGKQYAFDHFTSDVMAKNTIKVYNKLNL